MPGRLRLRPLLSLAFIIVVVLPLISLGTALSLYLHHIVEKDINKENLVVASQFRMTAQRYLQEPLNMLRHVGDMAGKKSLGHETLNTLLDSEVGSYSYYESIMILDRKGKVRNVGSGVMLHTRHDYIGLDLSSTDYIRRALATGAPAWSRTFISPFTGKPTLTLAYPFKEGVAIGNIDLLALSEIAGTIDFSKASTAYIVNSEGRIIAHPKKELVLQQASVGHLDVVRRGLSGTSEGFRYSHNGEDYFGITIPMEETGWLVVVERQTAEAFAFLNILKVFLAAAICCAIGIAYLFARAISTRIVEPLASLTDSAAQIGTGNYTPLSITGPCVEFHEIADGFNAMAHALASREKQLEDHNERLSVTQQELRRQVYEYERTDAELRQSEERYRALFEGSHDVVFITTPEGKLIDINPAGVALFGFNSKTEMLARGFTQHLYADPTERDQFVHDLQTHGFIKDHPLILKRITGEEIHVLVTATAISEGADKGLTFRGIMRDITEKKKLEQQLFHAQKLESIGTLAGGVAHDFNNILTVISSCAAMMERSAGDDPVAAKHVEMISKAAERGASLTRSLLAFSRKQVLNPQPVDLIALTRETAQFLKRIISEEIDLELSIPDDSLPVLADQMQIEQVLMNLVTNARDSMPCGGKIALSVQQGPLDSRFMEAAYAEGGPYAIISVTDSGEGISPDLVERIFDPFFTTKEVGRGTGLGLSMAYGIVKQHKGFIDVISELGKGSTFTVFLPIIEDISPVSKMHATVSFSGTGTILLVEDDPGVQEMAVSLLQEFGYRVVTASDGEEAVAVFRRQPDAIDLVILDVIMPKKNGKDAHDEIKSIRPDVPTIFMSGYAGDIIQRRGLGDSSLFLAKPVQADTFLNAIRQALDGRPPAPL